MHKSILFIALIISISIQSLVAQKSSDDFNPWYTSQFALADSVLMEGLPRDAAPIYEEIFKRARLENNHIIQLKVINDRMVNLCYYEENALFKVIQQLKNDMVLLDFPVNQVAHSILGNLYWQYYQQNRWRIHQRTTLHENAGEDLETWDLKRIVSEVINELNLSMKNPDKLYATPIGIFNKLLSGDTETRIYRPTVLDLLAHRALGIYQNEEAGLTSPVDAFTVYDPKYFNLANHFSTYNIPSGDSLSLCFRSVQLYQLLTQYHLKDTAQNALIDLDLNRLQYIHSHSNHALKDTLYKEVLINLSEQALSADVKLEILYRLAHFIYTLETGGSTNYYLESSRICKQVLKAYPENKHTHLFKQLLKKIKEPYLSLTSESLLQSNKPNLVKLDYKNLDTVYFKLYKMDLDWVKKSNQYNRTQIDTFKEKTAFMEWHQILPKANDYRTHHVEVPIKALEKGFYVIIVSDHKNLDGGINAVSTVVNTTDLLLHSRTLNDAKSLYMLYQRETGIPVEKAKIERYKSEYDYHTRTYKNTLVDEVLTGLQGLAEYNKKNSSYSLVVSYLGDTLFIPSTYRNEKPEDDNPEYKTVWYTDRGIYRPGQTVYFKGLKLICQGDTCSVLPNRVEKVTLYDPNDQELSSVTLSTNQFGTFSGSFILPTGLLNGEFSIQSSNGYKSFMVEEYKRPTFEINYKAISKSYHFNDSVQIEGTAMAYAGYPIDNAKISYRIHRKAELRWGCYWYGFKKENKQVAIGSATTDHSGNFSISYFTDDRDIADKNQIYAYTLTVDITDAHGETRTATHTLRVSQTPLVIKTALPDVIFTNSIPNLTIETNNINGGKTITDLHITTIRLIAPNRLVFDRAWEVPDVFLTDEAHFRVDFPNRVYKTETDPNTWTQGKTVFETKYHSTEKNTAFQKSFSSLKHGYYLVQINATDSSLQKTSWQKVVRVLQTKPQMPICTKDWVTPVKTSGEPGEVAEFWVAALHPDTPIRYELIHGNKLVDTQTIWAGKKVSKVQIPITEKYKGGFAVQFVQVAHGQSFISLQEIKVPYTHKMLDVSFISFRNKLLPGSKEQWKLSVKNKGGEKENAEMMATLYDASLDAFAPLNWETNFIHYKKHSWHKWRDNLKPRLSYSRNLSRTNYYLSWWNKNYETLNLNYNYFGGYNPHYRDLQNQIRYKKQAEERRKRMLELYQTTLKKMMVTNDSLWTLAKEGKADLIGKNGQLTGIITANNNKDPLVGVSILICGNKTGTISDINGNFTLNNLPKGVWLEIRFIGFKTTYKQVLTDSISVVLEEEIQELDEVMAIGYGRQKKSTLTGAMSSLSERSDRIRIRGASSEVLSIVENDMELSEDLDFEMKEDEEIEIKKEQDKIIPEIKTRKNFNETAFFYPHLHTDDKGEITIDFTIPEALTRWKMMGFTHTKDFKTGSVSHSLISQKDVSIMVNTPRFLRENDTIYFAAKVNNLSEGNIEGNAYIQLFDALNNQSIDKLLLQSDAKLPFSIAKGKSQSMRWKLVIPAGIQAVNYKVMAKAGQHTDGEENILPVLVNSKLVTESLPFMLRPNETAEYRFDKMVDQNSTTLRNEAYTIEYTSNPAWYAIQAMPYLMEYPYECAEQVFSRFFANSLSTTILNSSPRIAQVFKTWEATQPDALVSNLKKNQELKELLIQETPWLRNAQSETERKKRLGLLFDLNHMSRNIQSAFTKLQQKQTPNGGFAWFEGMPDNRYITQHITIGLAQLQHLEAIQSNDATKVDQMIRRGISYLDARLVEDYKNLQERERKGELKMEDDHLSWIQIHYLYCKSFFAPITPNENLQEAYNYFYQQAKTYGLVKDIYSQAMLAIALKRSNDDAMAAKLIKSLNNRAIRSKELGMYWRDNRYGYYWYQAPIETQAMLIEAFSEVSTDTAAIEEMKIWLLRNKQTSDWKTTKATVAACYALILRGVDQIAETKLLQVEVDGKSLESVKDVRAEAGTGYVKTTFTRDEIKPVMGQLKVHNPNNGVAWGAAYWQYFENLDKITSAETNLKIDKKLFVKEFTEAGAVLNEIKKDNPINVGDEVVVRVEIRADRDYEYVHLKDMRASGLEPISTTSQYRYRDGLGYYESVKDASENFFISYMRKGVYVFEYSLRAVHAGSFSNGITTLQCMYAPEFEANSQGVRIEIKK